jgi:hypothetical protein
MCYTPPPQLQTQHAQTSRQDVNLLRLKDIFEDDLDEEDNTIVLAGVCMNLEGILRYMNRNRLSMNRTNVLLSVFHIIIMSYLTDLMESPKIHFFQNISDEEYESFLREAELLYESVACHQLDVDNIEKEIALNLSWKYGAKIVMIREDHSYLAYTFMGMVDDLLLTFDMKESDECIQKGEL